MSQYDNAEVPYKSLLAKEYENSEIDFSKTLFKYSLDDEFQSYSILDRVIHYSFPPKSRCDFDLSGTPIPESIDVVIQFRDAVGKNYIYQTWLHSGYGDPKEVLVAGFTKPNFKPSKRIEYFSGRPLKEHLKYFRVISYMFFPERVYKFCKEIGNDVVSRFRLRLILDKHIRESLLRYISSGILKDNRSFEMEGRGQFKTLE
jgi:hypothetical protein